MLHFTWVRALSLCCCIGATTSLHAQGPAIAGPTQTCVGNTDTYTISPLPPGGVTWDILTPPVGATVLAVDQGSITFRWTSPASPYLLRANARIGTQTFTRDVTVAAEVRPTITSDAGVTCTESDPCLVYCLADFPLTFGVDIVGAVAWTSTGVLTVQPNGSTTVGDVSGFGAFTITAAVTSADGCVGEKTVCGRIPQPPAATISEQSFGTTQNITICRGQDLHFTYAPLLPPGARAEWRLSDGTVVTGPEFNHVFTTAGTYTLELYTGERCACVERIDKVDIVVEEGEQFELLCPEIVCAGDETVYRLDITRGLGLLCRDVTWTFVGAQSSTQVGPYEYRVVWPATGTAVGQVILTPGPGCEGCASPTIVDVPIVGAQLDIQQIGGACGGRTQSFRAPNLPGASLLWTISDPSGAIASVFPASGIGRDFQVTFNPGVYGQPVTVTLDVEYEVGNCSATSSVTIVQAPSIVAEPMRPCLGDAITLSLSPAGSYTGSANYTYGSMTGVWDFAQGPLILTPVTLATAQLTVTNLVFAGVSQPGCNRAFLINTRDVPPPSAILGPLAICPETSALYGVTLPAGLQGGPQIEWEVTGGKFESTGTTTATGVSVVVNWDGSGTYLLRVRLRIDGCASAWLSAVPTVADISFGTIEGDITPCVDAPTTTTYILSCGVPGQPCDAATNINWTIDNAYGSIIAGEGSATVQVQWHLPLGNNIFSTLRVGYLLCEQNADKELGVQLQTPGELGLTIKPSVECASSSFTFEAIANSVLTATAVTWTVTDQSGQSYSYSSVPSPGGGPITYTWDSGSTVPEVTAGPARLTARVTYANCSFRDIGYAEFELLYNPIPALSYIEPVPNCDGNTSLPTPVTLLTGTSAGASDVYFIWERVCGTTTTVVNQGFGLSSIVQTINPNDGCFYQVRTQRNYTRGNVVVPCERLSNPLTVSWPCGPAACGGYCPEVSILSNSGLEGGGTGCGDVIALAATKFCDGVAFDPIIENLSFGGWSSFPVPIPPLANGILSSNDPPQIALFSNTPHLFSRFTQPSVYYLSYDILGPSGCGRDRKPVEITLVPDFTARVACEGNPDYYVVQLGDLTDVINDGVITDYAWEMRSPAGNLLFSSSAVNPQDVIPAPTVSYLAQVCLTVNGQTGHINRGANYSCQVCKPVFVPGKPIGEIAVASEEVCKGTAFNFSYIDPMDLNSEFVWDFGDGTGSRLINPTKVYAQADVYNVSLTHTNSIGCSRTSSFEVNVNGGFIAGDLTVEVDELCQTDAKLIVELTDGDAPFAYQWSPFAAGTNTPAINVSQSGVYSVSVTDALGCRLDISDVPVYLRNPFPLGLSVPANVCASEIQIFLELPFVPPFTYYAQVDGGLATQLSNSFGGPVVYVTNLPPGTHQLSVFARSETGDECDRETTTFVVLPAPAAPLIELAEANCDPVVAFTYATVNGSVVDWYVRSQYRSTGISITIGDLESGASVSARARLGNCLGISSASLTVPNSTRPQIIAGCIENCEDLPNKLRDLSGGTYATWEWVFIPEGSSVPVPCNQPIRNPNLMLPSAVTEWNNFESCMDGTYYLLTTSIIDGMTCTFKSAELVIKCELPDPCTPPAWNPRDLTCFAAATGTEYYFNFDTPVLQGPGVSAPCDGANVTVSIGTLVGSILLTTEDSYHNLEGRVIVPAGTNLDLVCLTIPYCDALTQVCGSTQVCLGDAPNSGDVCPQGCGASVQYDSVSYSCSEQGSTAPYMVNLRLSDFRVNLPTGCSPQSVFMYNATGQMTDFALGFSGPNTLQGSVVGSQFIVPTLHFGYLTYTNQRQACFNIVLNGCKADGSEVNCSASICIDIPPGCYPSNNTGQNPEIECMASSNGLQYYEVYIPLGAQLTLPPGARVVGMSSGGISSTQTIGPGFIRMIIGVPIGTSDVWLVIGNPTPVRDSIELFGAPGQDYSQVWMPIPVQGDVVRHLRLPSCTPDMSPRVTAPFKSTTRNDLSERSLIELEIHPNPSSGRVDVTLTGKGAVDWPRVRLVNTEGQVQTAVVSPTSDKRASLELSDLPPGMYWLVGYATDGTPVQARVIKQ